MNPSVRVLILKSAQALMERGAVLPPLWERLAEIPCSRPDTPSVTCRYKSACAVPTMLANANGSRHQIIVHAGVNDDERGSVRSYYVNDGRTTPVSTSVDSIGGEIDAVSDGSPQLRDIIKDGRRRRALGHARHSGPPIARTLGR